MSLFLPLSLSLSSSIDLDNHLPERVVLEQSILINSACQRPPAIVIINFIRLQLTCFLLLFLSLYYLVSSWIELYKLFILCVSLYFKILFLGLHYNTKGTSPSQFNQVKWFFENIAFFLYSLH